MKPSHQSSSGAIVVQEQKIRELCKQLLACRSDAETVRLGRALRAALHEYIEQTHDLRRRSADMSRQIQTLSPLRDINEPREAEERIRLRAYQKFEERGREFGHDLDDWLEAEAEEAEARRRTEAA